MRSGLTERENWTKAIAELAVREAAAQGATAYGPARDRYLAEGAVPVSRYAGVAPTKADMLYMVDARVAAKKTKASKGAEWLDGMTDDATFWVEVNRRCRPQEKRKKKDARRGVGSQKGQAAAKKARKA